MLQNMEIYLMPELRTIIESYVHQGYDRAQSLVREAGKIVDSHLSTAVDAAEKVVGIGALFHPLFQMAKTGIEQGKKTYDEFQGHRVTYHQRVQPLEEQIAIWESARSCLGTDPLNEGEIRSSGQGGAITYLGFVYGPQLPDALGHLVCGPYHIENRIERYKIALQLIGSCKGLVEMSAPTSTILEISQPTLERIAHLQWDAMHSLDGAVRQIEIIVAKKSDDFTGVQDGLSQLSYALQEPIDLYSARRNEISTEHAKDVGAMAAKAGGVIIVSGVAAYSLARFFKVIPKPMQKLSTAADAAKKFMGGLPS